MTLVENRKLYKYKWILFLKKKNKKILIFYKWTIYMKRSNPKPCSKKE